MFTCAKRIHVSSRPTRQNTSRTARSLSLVLAIGLGLWGLAFSSIAWSATARSGSSFPVSVTAANGTVRLAAKPVRIISLSSTGTEMLFGIGAGRQVAAVDSDSDYPANAPRTKLSALDPNVEAIAKYQPDLVIVYYDTNGLIKGLEALHIPVMLEPAAANLTQAYGQIKELGLATGHASQAQTLIATMRSEIASFVAKAPHFSKPLTYYFEVGVSPYYSVTSQTFIGQILALFHMKNIADAAPSAAGGYPELSSEYIVEANPQAVFFADTLCCAQTTLSVSKRAGWSQITAVKNGALYALNDDIASRWGPRIVTFVATIEHDLAQLHAHDGA